MPSGQGFCKAISHLTFYVGNAKQSAIFYCQQFGFCPWKYQGLETGHRSSCAHAIKLNSIILVFVSSLGQSKTGQTHTRQIHMEQIEGQNFQTQTGQTTTQNCHFGNQILDDINEHLVIHGDAVKDIAFNVDDINQVVDQIKKRGGEILREQILYHDKHDPIKMVTVKPVFGHVTHTLIQRNHYPDDLFLPGWHESTLNYLMSTKSNTIWSQLAPVQLEFIDHVAVNQINGQMESTAKWYYHYYI